ncbi:stress responsive A/B barrel domain-containing protein [Drepanopeziza brunnea f. sp. 'multigermtubi' MB_m1]|uniref:Stress responsive A/B barrel domain-containing protein n=1 Tax=Marssonina brunnea f. sp. multigermtubi (strain MB_m1) TaxID=1072389 RepID=K1WB58_MARBU|nr:stress responsive A/B barrel domain-containing protein [Drepanopeziza brunnea f. sp. 'multigermtubi' MB_m1]EKD14540.1 stress responsive A/B barrel domain-containing protein [Drepanopeziza brunnea f. sp. 'multigermtubi' MB_m1]
MASKIIRVTMFKIPLAENQQKLLGCYKTLAATATKAHSFFYYIITQIPKNPTNPTLKILLSLKNFLLQNGKPYILSLEAGPAYADARSQGYTLVAKSEFRSLDDMKYYDEACEAHQKLKTNVKTLGSEGVMTIYYEPEVAVVASQ